ncbi:DUF6796 family protein [Aquimarina sp. MMG016]|uniref:DUF6796 family protein n=1 Tax=Aquimarina sp. MMG016 TaxID=2822690 RepID=UPI001B3A3E84|nr:DUF6796 family protein [Aquimarina sp. MMG016]MBQ4820712.1 hypothetical protein [Aquimarina sp. MMG016]
MKINQFWIRVFGLFGIIGGLTLFAGDMLFYYDHSNTNFRENMGRASDFRIIASAITALLAAWFYMLGVIQVYHAFKPSKPVVRNTLLFCFGAIVIAYGVIHGAYVSIATSAKLATQYNLDINEAVSLAAETSNVLRLFVYPIFGVLSILFIVQVWKRKTLYPRWIILFFPLIPFLIQDFICNNLSGKIWIIVCGGYLNLILIVFFMASTIALWNINRISNNE